MKRPEGKYMSTLRIGPKGQIVIPKEVRDMFDLAPGDSLVLLADKDRGIALQRASFFDRIVDEASAFADSLRRTKEEGEP